MLFLFFLSFFFYFPFDAKTHKLIWLVGSVINPLELAATGATHWDFPTETEANVH